MARVQFKRMIEGTTSPAIIKDGGYYYYDMPVYEDGTIDCWHMSSLSELNTELSNDWIVTKIPVGEILNIMYLGAFKVLDARWRFDTLNYYMHIRNIVQQMNPDMLGLYKESRLKKEFWDNRGVTFNACGTPYKVTGFTGYTFDSGSSFDIFCRAGVKWRLTALTVFEDESIVIDAIENRTFTFEEIKRLFDNNILTTSFAFPTWVTIDGLGEIQLDTMIYAQSSEEKLESIVKLIKQLNPQSDIDLRLKKLYLEAKTPKSVLKKNVAKKETVKKKTIKKEKVKSDNTVESKVESDEIAQIKELDKSTKTTLKQEPVQNTNKASKPDNDKSLEKVSTSKTKKRKNKATILNKEKATNNDNKNNASDRN